MKGQCENIVYVCNLEIKTVYYANNGAVIMRHIFIIGAKSIGQYGGYESFLDKLTEQHKNEKSIQYYIVTKANGAGCMDETKLLGVSSVRKAGVGKSENQEVISFKYNNANVLKLKTLQIGAAQAILYDIRAMQWCISYIKRHHIESPIIYVLACRIGPFFKPLIEKVHSLGGKVYVNPDGHEWKRSKWPRLIRMYWKESERLMVKQADLLVCDSVIIENYIKSEYAAYSPLTVYISYGADIRKSIISDDDPKYLNWLSEHKIKPFNYYMCCGRFVPENSFEIMIREFMRSNSSRDFVIITTKNDRFLDKLDNRLGWRRDKRIKLVGTVYDSELLKKIRENAYGNFHGHTVGGTNPSLLEALSSTDLNLLIDVGFNRVVANDSALYWNSVEGSLSRLIDEADIMDDHQRSLYGSKAKERIKDSFSWDYIGNKYKELWLE